MYFQQFYFYEHFSDPLVIGALELGGHLADELRISEQRIARNEWFRYHGGAFGQTVSSQSVGWLGWRNGHFVGVLEAQFDDAGVVLAQLGRVAQSQTRTVDPVSASTRIVVVHLQHYVAVEFGTTQSQASFLRFQS